jgi:hypothetical protein
VTQASEPHTLGWRAGLLVFALALAWRFAYLGVAAMEAAFYAPALDSYWHVQWGSAIAHGTLWLSEPFFRAPLYPYFLGALLWVFNGDLLLVRVAQIFVGAGSATLGAVLGARLFGRWVGVVAGVLLASATSLVMFDLELLIAVILVPLVICALLAIERATRAPSISAWLTVGLLLGATAIARPNILLFVPVALLLLTLAARAHGWRGWRLTAGLLVVLGGVALPIAPVTVHNAVVGRDLVLISSQAAPLGASDPPIPSRTPRTVRTPTPSCLRLATLPARRSGVRSRRRRSHDSGFARDSTGFAPSQSHGCV